MIHRRYNSEKKMILWEYQYREVWITLSLLIIKVCTLDYMKKAIVHYISCKIYYLKEFYTEREREMESERDSSVFQFTP